MSSAGTAYIDFVPSFGDIVQRARREGQRAGQAMEAGFGGRSVGQVIGSDVTDGLQGGMDPGEVGRQLGSDLADGASTGFDGGGLGDKVKDLAGPMGAMAATVGLAAGAALGAGVIAGFTDAVERQGGKNMIQAQLGISEADAAELGASAGRVWAGNFGDSMGAARDAVVAVRSSIGSDLGQGAIEDLTEKALTFQDVFGSEVPEVVNAAGIAIRTGLARDGVEAMDLLFAASQRMPAHVRSELLPTVEEYSTYLASLGFTGEQAFGLLVSGSQGGTIALDKTGDALKELSIRATDMSATSISAYETAGLNATQMSNDILAGGDMAKGAFDQIVTGLLGIEDPTQQAVAAIGLFGTPLEDLGVEQIPQFLEGLRDSDGAMDDFTGSAQDAADALGEGLGARVESVRRAALGGLVSFIEASVLPRVDDLIGRGERFATVLWDRAEPAVDDVAATLGHLVSIGDQAYDSVEPIGAALAAVGGGGVLIALAGIASGLETTFGWLERNDGLVRLLTAGVVVFGGLRAWSLVIGFLETMYIRWLYFSGAVTSTTIVSSLGNIVGGLGAVATGALTMGQTTQAGMARAKAGVQGLTTSVTLANAAFAAVTIGAISIWQEHSKQVANAKAEIEGIRPANFDERSLSQMDDYTVLLSQYASETYGATYGTSRLERATGALIDGLPLLENGMIRNITTAQEAQKAYGDQEAQTRALRTAYQETWELVNDHPIEPGRWLGVDDPAWGEMEDWIERLDLDPVTQNYQEMANAILGYLQTTAAEAGYRGDQIQRAMELSPEELERQKAAWEEMSTAVQQSWGAALDSVAGLGGLVEEGQALTSEQIETWYALQIGATEEFATNIGRAFELGYDPTLVSSLLQAGPAEAGPIVQGMVDNHSANLLWMVNSGENALQQLNLRAIEMARLTHLATTSESAAMAAELGNAMRISEFIARTGGQATASAIAEELGIGVDRVRDIADGYGIELAEAVNPVLSAIGAPIIDRGARSPTQVLPGGGRYNAGGFIPGPDVDRDVIPAWLTPHEYVLTRDMTSEAGIGNLEAWRRRSNAGVRSEQVPLPGYNAGGEVLLAGARRLHDAGARISAHPMFGAGPRPGVHAPNSYHYRNTSGTGADAFDANTAAGQSAGEQAFFDRWAPKIAAMGLRVLWRVAGHFDHLHADLGGPGYGMGGFGGSHFAVDIPPPPSIGDWPLARGGEGAMRMAYEAAKDFADSSYGMMIDGTGQGGSPSAVRSLVQQLAAERGWVGTQWEALDRLIQKESSWDPGAANPTSSARGLFQKLTRLHGPVEPTVAGQAGWGFDYIAKTYGDPIRALRFHLANNWYNAGGPVLPDFAARRGTEPVFVHQQTWDEGGWLREGLNLVDNQTGGPEELRPPAEGGPAMLVQGNLVVADRTDVDLLAQKIDRRRRRRRVR
jgi:hypothetical protein